MKKPLKVPRRASLQGLSLWSRWMAARKNREFKFRPSIAEEPMPAAEWEAAEGLLARLIARAYAADHPELLQARRTESTDPKSSGPPTAAAAVAGALPASAGGPDRESGEHDSSKDLSTE